MTQHIHIQPGEVHLWWCDSDEPRTPADVAAPDVLDDEERTRASRFRFHRDASRFRNRRAFTRCVLAGYLGLAPQDVQLLASHRGKPHLRPGRGLSFNVSHADGVTLVAVAAGEPVGVDIERRRHLPEAAELAVRYFAPREAEQVVVARGSARSDAFLDLWTRKESLLKALGTGLSTPLDRFDVSSIDSHGRVRPRGKQGELPFVIARLGSREDLIGSVALSGDAVTVTSMAGPARAWGREAGGSAR